MSRTERFSDTDRRARRWVIAASALLSCTVVAGVVNHAVQLHAQRFCRSHDDATVALAGRVAARFDQIAVAVTAARGLFVASSTVELAEWEAFAGALREGRSLEDTSGIAFVQRVPPGQGEEFLAAVRSSDGVDFPAVAGEASDREAAVVRFLAANGVPRFGKGDDLASSPVVAEVLARARSSSHIVAAPVGLPGADPTDCSLLLCEPVFANGLPTATPEERDAACEGWVVVPVVVGTLVARARAEDELLNRHGDVTLAEVDGGPDSSVAHVPSGAMGGARHGASAVFDFGGKRFRISTTAGLPTFWESIDANGSMISIAVAASSLLMTIVLAAAWSSRRAHALAARMTEHLRDSETRFRDLADASPVLMWIVDADGRTTFFNRAWLDFTGGRAEEQLGASFGARIHPEDRARVVAIAAQHAARRLPWTAEYRLKKVDGSHCWVHCTASPRYGHDDRFLGYVGGCIDVDDRKQATAAAAEAHARLQVFVEQAPAAVAMLDRELRYVACSRRWLADYGLEGRSVVGLAHYDVFPEIPDRWRAIHARCLAGAAEQSQADPFDRADGRRQWLRWDVRPWRDAHGEIGGLLMFTEDITGSLEAARLREVTAVVMEAVAAERPLREVLTILTECADTLNEDLRASVLLLRDGRLWEGAAPSMPAEYNALIDGVRIGPNVGSCGTAAFTGQRVVVADTHVDPRWAAFVELPKRFGFRACWSQPILAGSKNGEQRVLGTFASYCSVVREPSPQEIRFVEELAHLAAVAIERCNASEALRSTLADLTAARSQAEAANHAKSEFLANMSHEIRTPMTAILGFTDVLAEEVDSPLSPAERREALVAIRRNGDHLLAIINDVLDISKIEAGKLTVERIATDARVIVEEVASLLRERAEAKRITLDVVHADGVPAAFSCDPFRLRQILMNLVGNAIKFTDTGGVTVQLAAACAADGGPTLCVSVRDTGIGMTPEQCSQLFQAFTQADNSTTRRFGGTGLGLRISKRLAQALGGDITVTSMQGRGSVFTLVLPTEVVAAPQPASPPAKKAKDVSCDLSGARVLLAEDGRDNQRLISMLLQRAGATVTVAENGRIAVGALCENGDVTGPLRSPCPYDLVLLDMQMPELDGFATASLLRRKGFERPVIALTANALAGDRERCIAAGCDDYLKKPVERSVLLAACERAVFGGH